MLLFEEADDAWLYYYDPTIKQQSSEWKRPSSPTLRKAKTVKSAVTRRPSVSQTFSIGLGTGEPLVTPYAVLIELQESSPQDKLYTVRHYTVLKEKNHQWLQRKRSLSQNVGGMDSRKPFFPTISGCNTIRSWSLTSSTGVGIMFVTN
ncbi:hypothetical protein TNCV_3014741 [Trichonephila clavipes]|nr:hypothetical protein TNCV_3014741 [Trichonephila clavipes]